jgi:hypothetical protein
VRRDDVIYRRYRKSARSHTGEIAMPHDYDSDHETELYDALNVFNVEFHAGKTRAIVLSLAVLGVVLVAVHYFG